MIDRVADTGLRREVDNAIRPLLGEGCLDDGSVSEIALEKAKALVLLEAVKPGLFQRHVVIGAEIVETDDLVPAVEQPHRRVITYEAGGAGNQNAHGPLSEPVASLVRARQESHRDQSLSIASWAQNGRLPAWLTLLRVLVIEQPDYPKTLFSRLLEP
jgi:hypothetical protein